jgi:hypothetical protein
MNLKNKMVLGKIIKEMILQTMSFMAMRKLGILDILTEASWIWDILDMGMEFIWISSMLGPTGSSKLDCIKNIHKNIHKTFIKQQFLLNTDINFQ